MFQQQSSPSIETHRKCTNLAQIIKRVSGSFQRRRLPEIQQTQTTECGAACLAMILNYYGRKTGLAEIREHCGIGRDGLSALALVKAGRDYGLRVRSIARKHSNLSDIPLPAIVHWRFNHFIVVERWTQQWVEVVDPAEGRQRLSTEEFDEGFTGIILMFEPGAQFSRDARKAKISLWSYFRQMFHAPGIIAQILGASLLLQVLGLCVPVLTQIIVDQFIPANMTGLLGILGLGLLIIVLAQTVTSLLRATLLIYLQTHIDARMMLNFFEHLLTLPYHFFQQRLNGDLLTRLNSNTMIRTILTNQLLSSVLDGSFVLVYLVIILAISPLYGLVALGLGLCQVVLLVGTTRPIHRLTQKELVAQGRMQGYMNEALGGIATLKAAGAEERILERWTNLFFDQLNISMRRNYLSTLVDTALFALQVGAPLALLWIGATQVLAGMMTLGTMLALNALVSSFLTPLTSLANSGKGLQQVRAHFDRITDVLEAEAEQDRTRVALPPRLAGRIELTHVNFRYDPRAPLALQDINLTIEPGQKIALVGHTGSGKSTLGKLLLGLYQPTSGEIRYDGLALDTLNLQAVRNQFGVVLQEATIFNGSIRENIAFNDPDMSMEAVVTAAQMTALHDDIMQMPMQYETIVSEAGSALSGGQRQRIALARALAHEPALLLFDEATSHLDVLTEQIIEQSMRKLKCTRVIIAHRLSTIRDADRILLLDQGKIVEQGTHTELLRLRGLYAQLIEAQVENGTGTTHEEIDTTRRESRAVFLTVKRPQSQPTTKNVQKSWGFKKITLRGMKTPRVS